MSDAVTNVEIEDVLSSIRRLVSEDTRPSRDAQPNPMADRLVLTPAFRVPDAQEDAPEAAEDDDHGVLDEEALRDLVSELVRDELQGALGERITRNVRKLVRREIHRALASMELE
jgi:cell pole-organizing protein PopZ